MLKIFHILSGKANPNTLNGVNKVVDAIATEQYNLGFDVTVCGVARNTIVRHSPKYNYKLFQTNKCSFSYPPELLSYLIENSDEGSIFHFHSVFILWYLPLINTLKKQGRCHIFLTPHGAYIPVAMNSLKKKIAFSLFDSKILSNVEAVHIIGYQTENNDYVKRYAKKIVFIPNGFGVQKLPVSEAYENTELVFGYLGRLAMRHKGLDELIKAFAEYKRNGGIGMLRIAGAGPDESNLKELVRIEEMNDYVSFEGVLFEELKWKFLQEISTLISPSRWDGLPTSCLEAAAVGRPLIVTAETNLGEFIDKYGAGLLITRPEKLAIMTKMFEFEEIFNTPLIYKKMCDASKKMIREELNWKSITERIVRELYCC